MSSTGALNRARGGAGVDVGSSPRRRPRRDRNAALYSALVLPSALLLLLINVYPFVYAASQSVHDGSLISTGDYVGLDNYTQILGSADFWNAARFTAIFTIVGVFGSWAAGTGLALLLRSRVPGSNVFKVLLMLPWVVPIVVSSTAWNWLVATPQSPLPTLARLLGFENPLFLADPTLAVITVCVFKVWVSFPFMMLMSSSALSGIDHSVYEAASMDGASSWQRLTRITLPLISRTTYISWILMTIFCVNDFPTIFLLTGGGPVNATTSLVVLAYKIVFTNFQTGPGVAIAFLMTLVLVVVSTVLYRMIRKVDIE